MFIDYSNPNNVIIQHNKHRFQGKFIEESRTWLHIAEESNLYIYEVIGINDVKSIYKFISSIVGYEVCDNSVYNVSDLVKVLNAINKEYDRQFGNKTTLKSSDFVVGEKVLVRNDLEIGKKYGGYTAVRGHISLSNRVVTIRKIDYDDDTLKIEEDTCDLWWSPEMFIKLPSLTDTNMIGPLKVILSRNVSFKAEESKNSTISINNFIKSKKHYQLNFNN